MDKRKFIKTAGIIATGSVVFPYFSCNPKQPAENNTTKQPESEGQTAEFKQSKLPYEFAALEPHIDARTMEIHYGKHHAGYVRKLNNALTDSPLNGKTLNEILASVTENDTGVRNNGGGHYNHTLFWDSMAPGAGGAPSGKIADAVNGVFGSYDQFKEAFSKAALTVFGSGWAWLCKDAENNLFISSTPNQDNPLMANIVEEKGTPILGLDVWEHAYYLKYQNLRENTLEISSI